MLEGEALGLWVHRVSGWVGTPGPCAASGQRCWTPSDKGALLSVGSSDVWTQLPARLSPSPSLSSVFWGHSEVAPSFPKGQPFREVAVPGMGVSSGLSLSISSDHRAHIVGWTGTWYYRGPHRPGK